MCHQLYMWSMGEDMTEEIEVVIKNVGEFAEEIFEIYRQAFEELT